VDKEAGIEVRTAVPRVRIRGIEVGIHVSWLVVFALVTWPIAMGFVPQLLPGISSREPGSSARSRPSCCSPQCCSTSWRIR
jgi:hypothetical protein